MDEREALGALGLSEGATLVEVRAAYHALLRDHHPDVVGEGELAAAHQRTTRLIEAYDVLVAFAETTGTTTITFPAPAPAPPSGSPAAAAAPSSRAELLDDDPFDLIDAQALDEDTIAVDAPPPETYAALYEAAGQIGEISYYDRQLGILETIVRFEGGPSCSVVMTLQGRAHHTEVFCTMESIEATPAPPIGPVIDALVEALEAL